jgi:hypothetical protein
VKNGQADLAAQALDNLSKKLKGQGLSAEEIRGQMDDYKSALADRQVRAGTGRPVHGSVRQGRPGHAGQAGRTEGQSADGLRQSIQALNDVNRAGAGAMNAFEQSIDDAAKAAQTNAGALSMQHGELDLNSQRARDAESALRDLAANTDDAAAKAREQGKSWEYVQGIMTRGQQTFVDTAMKMGLTKTQAQALAQSYLDIPDSKATKVEMQAEDAKNDLAAFNAAVKASPGTKSVTLKTLSAAAEQILEAFGYKVTHLKDGSVTVTAKTGAALSGVHNVAGAIAALRDKTVTVTTVRQTVFTTKGSKSAVAPAHRDYAAGGVVDYYARGGIRPGRVSFFANGSADPGDRRNQHVAQIVPAGSWRVFGEDETQGEGYVPFRMSARPRSRKITEEIVRRLGGNPEAIQWNAGGNITAFAGGGFTYTPTGTMKSASDVQSSYSGSHQSITKDQYNKTLRARANAVDSLRAAEARLAQVRKHKHTHAQLVAAENAVAKARRSVATATDAAKSAEARYKKQFNLSDWGKTLASAVKSNAAYESNLKKIAARGGSDVVDQLRDMGAEGATMVSALAKASKSQFNSIVANLRKLAPLAKATLADYTAQLSASNKTSSTFQANLAKLAGMGYGDLATQLAAQGDENAQKLAASAVKDKGAASKANTAAKTAGQALTSEQVSELVQIIAAIKTKSTGIHAVAATTSLNEDEIITVATKAKAQIFSSLGSRANQFLADLGRANKGLSYANGGIRPGIYATRGGAVTFAEPETGGEAFLPLSPSKRRSALPVLNDVARRFGVGLTDVAASRGVVIIREGGDTHVSVTAVRTGATASDIGSQVGRSVRRARRGGVAARAA